MSFDREKSIFLAAIDSPSDSARQAYLADACGRDPNLRRAVDELLAAHDCSTNVVDQQPDSFVRLREDWGYAVTSLRKERSRNSGSTESDCDGDQIGERIGPYRLMEKIGEGGFGQVFVAEQVKPLRRRVALKLLKPWMGSKEVIARFEAERQALAMMDHPNIARVLDAGTTAAGQPYFVMELVRGVPITEFCDEPSAHNPATVGVVCRRLSGRAARTPKRNHSSGSEAHRM